MNDSVGHPAPRESLFCSKPFEFLDIGAHPRRGDAYLCCPSWLPKPAGNLSESSIEEVWNGESARSIRRSILDGSFRHCSKNCPFLETATGPVQKLSEVTNPVHLEIIAQRAESLSRGPRVVNAAFDRSCNLSCPSCRTRKIIEQDAEDEILALQKKVELSALSEARVLYITGSGDAFGSPYFFSWLRSFDPAPYPQLRLHIHTNAQLLTPQRWRKISPQVRERIDTCDISIDAASSATYLLNRRGGEWETLLENLQFISQLRKAGELRHVMISMVVQENNFSEMPEFVRLGRRFAIDHVYFRHLVDWGTFSHAEMVRRSIHLKSHPRHAELMQVLDDPGLHDPIVDLGKFGELVPARCRHSSGGDGYGRDTAPQSTSANGDVSRDPETLSA
jgi:MoaA/NifB/PqqE/SkfB family radical SAM enzyme